MLQTPGYSMRCNDAHLVYLDQGLRSKSKPWVVWITGSISYFFQWCLLDVIMHWSLSLNGGIYVLVWTSPFIASFQLKDLPCISDLGDVCNSVLWWPSGKQDKLVSIDEENIFLWTLDCPRKTAQVRAKGLFYFTIVKWLKLLLGIFYIA